MASNRALSHAPWSASKIQTALRCPRLFYYRYVDKIKELETTSEARVGKAVHTVLERVLQGAARAEVAAEVRGELDAEYESERFDALQAGVEAFEARIERFRRRHRVYRAFVEYTLAIREDGTRAAFYAGDAFFRGIVDAAFLFDEGVLAVVDHKTGVRTSERGIGEQLEGYAVLAAACFRGVRRVWLGIHWVRDEYVSWAPAVTIEEIQTRFVPGLRRNIEAAALAVDDGPRPLLGRWCRWCGYRSICPAAARTGLGLAPGFGHMPDDSEPWE